MIERMKNKPPPHPERVSQPVKVGRATTLERKPQERKVLLKNWKR